LRSLNICAASPAIGNGVPFRAGDRPLLVGVRHDQARIDRKLFTTDQSGRNTRFNDTLKDPAENVVVTELKWTPELGPGIPEVKV
jgi:hypothetical protein